MWLVSLFLHVGLRRVRRKNIDLINISYPNTFQEIVQTMRKWLTSVRLKYRRVTDRVNFNKELGKHGLIVTFSCDPSILEHSSHPHLQGVLFMPSENRRLRKVVTLFCLNFKVIAISLKDNSFLKMKTEYFGYWYKWIIVGQELPEYVSYMRYDADVFLIRTPDNSTETG